MPGRRAGSGIRWVALLRGINVGRAKRVAMADLRAAVEGLGFELVHIDLEKQRGAWFLRIYIDKPGGVTLDDCAQASRQVSTELDVEEVVPGRYTLEISSPGLDRPLRTDEDFLRFVGRKVFIHTREPLHQQRNFVGLLKSLEAGVVTLQDAQGALWAIPRDLITKARLEIEI